MTVNIDLGEEPTPGAENPKTINMFEKSFFKPLRDAEKNVSTNKQTLFTFGIGLIFSNETKKVYFLI